MEIGKEQAPSVPMRKTIEAKDFLFEKQGEQRRFVVDGVDIFEELTEVEMLTVQITCGGAFVILTRDM